MTTSESAPAGGSSAFDRAGRLGSMRRKLLLLAGVGAAVAAKVATDAVSTVQAAGRVIGAPVGYTPYDAQSDGVQGYAVGDDNAGTLGRNNDLNGVGVYGVAPNGVAVHGESASGTAVGARSGSGHAVYAVSTGGHGVIASSTNDDAIWGDSGNQYGVVGRTAATSAGVWGESPNGVGVQGRVYTGGAGVVGESANASGVGLIAISPGTAAAFYGAVQVNGSFTVAPGFAKSAAVPHPDGSVRRMYCVESPESLFEDSGAGQLTSGRAQVRLDADFAAVVKADNYQVFVTPEGDCNGLYVTAKTPTGFEVRELKVGTSTLPFGYRVLAKRKDLTAARMERVTIHEKPAQRPSPTPPAELSSPRDRGAPSPTATPAPRTP